MSARDKLEEAKFFLEKLRVSSQGLPQDLPTQRESCYYLSRFQCASVSVMDYLLEDYNVKFGLNIPLSERYFRGAFKREAKRLGNEAALNFFNWWRGQKESLANDPIGKQVIGKRHIQIHRVPTKPDLAKIKTGDGIVPRVAEPSFNWFSSDYADEPIITVCEKFLGKLGSLVLEAENRFL
ncbi:MAG: hypothetical protein E3J66_05865 [Dehalococcoidia bacterium]|nr:MAG: hypothetical protein E3J66_05865 [Dehalococcoidia bacterium]